MATRSLAAETYGEARLTNDVDLVIILSAENAVRFHETYDPLHAWAFEQREHVFVGMEAVWIAPPEYVILRKLQYFRKGGSPKHVSDITAMLAVLGDRIDRVMLHERIEQERLGAAWVTVQRTIEDAN